LVDGILPLVLGGGGVQQDIPSHVIGEDVKIPREPDGPFLPELGESSGLSLLLDQAGRLIHEGSNVPRLLGLRGIAICRRAN